MDKKVKQKLDAGSEIFLWLAIEELGGFLWRMNHDLADGRIDSTPGIEKDLILVLHSTNSFPLAEYQRTENSLHRDKR